LNKWYKLDNAAKLFPSVKSIKNSSVYRVSAILTEPVDKEILQKTVDHIYDRFPMLFVKMHKGVFWNYFDNNWHKFLVLEETDFPCSNINQFENNGYFIKILYFNKRISVELFHSLTDGFGAIEFLKTILFYYLNFSDNCIDSEGKIILIDNGVSEDDTSDSFLPNYKKIKHSGKKPKRAFRIKGTSFGSYGNNIITGVVSADELNKQSKAKNATITSYLTSVLIYSIYMARQKHTNNKNPIFVSIPVNLRKAFPSKTLRNFFVVANIGLSIDSSTKLEDVFKEISSQLKEKTEKSALQLLISDNMKFENSIFSRFVPLFLKKIFIAIYFNFIGEMRRTITLSNIGNVSVPSGFSSKVSLIEAILYPTPKCPVNCGICSVNDKIAISFSRTILEPDIIRYFFNYLSETDGLDVTVYSNDWGKNN